MAGLQTRPGRLPRRSGRLAAMVVLSLSLLAPAAALAGSASRSAPHDQRSKELHARLARGRFLVANRSLEDPTFFEAVVLLVDYDETGALGIVVNRPTDVPLIAALPEVKELRKRKDLVFLGGPVARDRMVLLLRAPAAPPESIQLFEKVYATGSLAALRRSIARGDAV